jgi:hypothetical protein
MRYLAIVTLCAAMMMGGKGMAQASPPPPPDGGINFFHTSPCIDNETGERGICFVGHDKSGTLYLTFFQQGVLMFIRKVTGENTYEVVWVRPGYASY